MSVTSTTVVQAVPGMTTLPTNNYFSDLLPHTSNFAYNNHARGKDRGGVLFRYKICALRMQQVYVSSLSTRHISTRKLERQDQNGNRRLDRPFNLF